ncbi:MAG: formyltransferase family protein, partial [Proteobacteria bacterium]|nr:formyltransferase family protein [Pseudomonadota bacterium]
DSGARFGGCTVHFVRAEMDNGPIIIQAAVPIRPDDNADTLGLRVLRAEHICYPHALRLIAEGRTRIRGNLVEIEESAALEGAVFNPPIA